MTHTYFENLNYTLSNEDTFFEYSLLPLKTPHVLSIAGSGSRVLPLFGKIPLKMSICDFSIEQLALTATRIATVKKLDYQQFLAFWGYPCEEIIYNTQRMKIFETLDIPEQYRSIMREIFAAHNWSALIYVGKYEKTLIQFSKIIQTFLGTKHIKKLKLIEHHTEFRDYLYDQFPYIRWKMIIRLLGNSTLMNALLYKGRLPKKNINISYTGYYRQIFNNLFRFLTPRESFFLQLIFFGKIEFIQGAPFETDYSLFNKMKEGVHNCNIQFYQGDLFSIIEKIKTPIDFVSFSDILSYFPKDLEEIYLQKMKKNLNPKALTVHRYYLHVNKNLNTSGFDKVTPLFSELIQKEKTQFYLIDIYQRKDHE